MTSPTDAEFDVLPYVDGVGALLAGTANVIMQLSWPEVGYGVLESPVDSGKATLHPVKRFRTTFSYLAVAILGDDTDRAAYREAVNSSHRQVRSTPDSPVAYNAFDPELQLWVAACLYYGFVDVYQQLHGPLDDARADVLYRYSARMGTTLQVREQMWPADREAFEKYWTEGLNRVRIDPPVRAYLLSLMRLTFLPRPIRLLGARASVLFTTAFLPQPFRDELGLAWTDRDQRGFERRMRLIRFLNALLPGPIRRMPFNLFLRDVRRRVRTGRPLV